MSAQEEHDRVLVVFDRLFIAFAVAGVVASALVLAGFIAVLTMP